MATLSFDDGMFGNESLREKDMDDIEDFFVWVGARTGIDGKSSVVSLLRLEE